MLPDKIIYTSINNNFYHMHYQNNYYNGTYQIVITSASSIGPACYYEICKFDTEPAYIYKKTSNLFRAEIVIEWPDNSTPRIYTINNNNNETFNNIIKIYSY